MKIGLYYDNRLERVGMEFLYEYNIGSKKIETIKIVKEYLSRAKDTITISGEEYKTELLNYDSIKDFLEKGKEEKGNVLVFLQDVIPYSAFNSSYSDLFSLNSRLGQFLSAGNVVVWLGDVPFFYRYYCVDADIDKDTFMRIFEERNKYSIDFNFNKAHLHPTKLEDGTLCYRDIIYTAYFIFKPQEKDIETRYIWFNTRYLGFFDLSDVCYLEEEKSGELTILGKLLD